MNKKYAIGLAVTTIAFIACLIFARNIVTHGKKEITFQTERADKLQAELDLLKSQVQKEKELAPQVFLDVWRDAYLQAAYDFHFKVPQISIIEEGDQFGVWAKISFFKNPDSLSTFDPLMPDELAPLPERETVLTKKR